MANSFRWIDYPQKLPSYHLLGLGRYIMRVDFVLHYVFFSVKPKSTKATVTFPLNQWENCDPEGDECHILTFFSKTIDLIK